MAMKTIVALRDQGIGPEVVNAMCEPLMGTGLPLKILTPPQGNPLPEETKWAAREAGGVLFGAARPSTSRVVAWLRREMSAWAGVRRIRFYPRMRSPLADPEGIDYILLRENGEGIYPGRDGAQGEGLRHRGAIHREIARFAGELARIRKAQDGTAKTREMAQAVLAAYRG